MKILIPNAPEGKNLGDLAIFEGLISLLETTQNKIVIHTFDPQQAETRSKFIIRPRLYYWAVFYKRNLFTRVKRLITLFTALILPRPIDSLLNKQLEIILKDYQKADRIILNGGGYFRSQKGLTQQINSLMNTLPLLFAKKYKKRVTIRPISFGPFSSKITEFICAHLVNLADEIYIRDKQSYNLLNKYISKNKLKSAPDEAFNLTPQITKRPRKRILGFTVREWVETSQRSLFISNFAKLVAQLAKDKKSITIQPIIQVNAPQYNEGDENITGEVAQILKTMGLNVIKTQKPTTLRQALIAYGKLSYLVGMRMHSCIFASLQKTPFTSIAYEHKHYLLTPIADKIIQVEDLTKDISLSESNSEREQSLLSVTVGIPAYNEEANIKNLLDSLLLQKKNNFKLKEIIVISDGSTDKTIEIAKSIKSPLIKIIESKTRHGQQETQNQLVSIFKGDILVIIEADTLPYDLNTINYLVIPFVKSKSQILGMVVGKAVSLEAETLVEKIKSHGSEIKDHLFSEWRNGNNFYFAVGYAMKALSRNFTCELIWPRDVPEDSYAYLRLKQLGLQMKKQPEARAYVKKAANLKDCVRRNKKFVGGIESLKKYFPEDLIKREFFPPLKLKTKHVLIEIINSPLLTILYLLQLSLIRIVNIRVKDFDSFYQSFHSTKNLNSLNCGKDK